MADIILERIRNPCIEDADPTLPLMLVPASIQGFVHHMIEVVVMGEEDMAPDIPGKTTFIDEGCRETADMVITFKNLPIGLTELREVIASTKATGSRTEDDIVHNSLTILDNSYNLRAELDHLKC